MSTNTPGPWAYGKALVFLGGLLGACSIFEPIAHPASPARIDRPRPASQPAADEGKTSLRQGLVRLHPTNAKAIISI